MPPVFITFDIVNLLLLTIFIVDNCLYAYTFGIEKRVRQFHLAFEFLLIAIIMTLSVIEIFNTNIRFRAFYLRFLDIILLWRKLTVSQMLFVQLAMKQSFLKLKTDQMNPDERIIAILRFIEANHRGIFKCVVNEMRYCVRMITTG